LFKSEANTAPVLAAVICRKGGEKTAVELLKKYDLATDDIEEIDDTVVYKQVAFDTDDATGFKLNDDIAVIVTGVVQKFSTYSDSVLFAENLSLNGFFPTLRMAQESLGETIYNVMYARETKAEKVPLVKSALDDFGSFVSAMLENMPETVTKLAKELDVVFKVVTNDPHPKEDKEAADKSKAEVDAVNEANAAAAKAKDDKAKQPTKVEDGVAKPAHDDSTAPAGDASAAAAAAGEEGEESAEGVQKADMLSSINAMLTEQLKPLISRLDTVEQVAKSAKSSGTELRNTVLGTDESNDDNHNFQNPIKKSAPVGSDDFWAGTLSGLGLPN
jgi:hypothetical protein